MHDKTTIPHITTANLIIDYGYTFQVPKPCSCHPLYSWGCLCEIFTSDN